MRRTPIRVRLCYVVVELIFCAIVAFVTKLVLDWLVGTDLDWLMLTAMYIAGACLHWLFKQLFNSARRRAMSGRSSGTGQAE